MGSLTYGCRNQKHRRTLMKQSTRAKLLLSAIGEVTEDRFAHTIGRLFELMEFAEDEIDRAKRRHPKWEEALDKTFRALQPGTLGRQVSEEQYRRHCRELLDRVPARTPLDAPTRIELLLLFSKYTAEHMPHRVAQAAYAELFREEYPDRHAEIWDGDHAPTFDEYEKQEAKQFRRDIEAKLAPKIREIRGA